MAYRKSSRNQNFTVVFQEVAQHESLTLEAKGLLLFMLSLPEDWVYHKQWLQDQCPGCGREKLARILKELETFGYLIRTTKRSEDGKKLAGWNWEILGESTLKSDLRQTRQSDSEVRQTSTKPDLRVSSQSDNQSDGQTTATKDTDIKKKESKSVNSTQTEIFSEKVMVELLSDNLPESKLRYAQLKIREYEDRFPESKSIADCWSYVVQAVNHQSNLTG